MGTLDQGCGSDKSEWGDCGPNREASRFDPDRIEAHGFPLPIFAVRVCPVGWTPLLLPKVTSLSIVRGDPFEELSAPCG